MRNNIEDVIANPTDMVNFFYDYQSKGRRYDIQNRLFIVHHSFVNQSREFYLRCAWEYKEKIFKKFCDNIEKVHFICTHNVIAGVIFILETQNGQLDYKISGLNL